MPSSKARAWPALFRRGTPCTETSWVHSRGLSPTGTKSALQPAALLALATGTAVAQTGLIAFVGLAAPHLVRAVVKVPHGRLMVLASLMGAVLLAGADLLARGLIAPVDPQHLMLFIWSATRTYTNFGWRMASLTGVQVPQADDYALAAQTITRLVLQGAAAAD